MQSEAKTIDAYLAELPTDRREAVSRLRKLCRETLKGYEEGMDYGLPCFKRGGVVEIGFASQRNYISLYCLKKEVLDAHRGLLEGLSVGKGCIRYPKPEKIDFAVVKKLLVATAKSGAKPC
jgi:uncharacterized protein YdhG (YjbR/CyaY superfamily)